MPSWIAVQRAQVQLQPSHIFHAKRRYCEKPYIGVRRGDADQAFF